MVLKRTRADRTLVDVAVRDLREEILQGALKPGTSLVLAEIAERMSMSVMPIREALRKLEAEGLVDIIPHRGARVSELSLADLEDLYSVRMQLESLAVKRAALNFSEEDYMRFSKILEDYFEAYADGNDERGRDRHSAFHLGLYELAKSRWLTRTIKPLWEAADRYQRMSIELRGTIDERWREHYKILDYCQQREPEAAGRALEEHLQRTLNLIREELFKQEVASGR